MNIISIDDAITQLNLDPNKDLNTRSLHKTNGMSILLIALNAGAELKQHTAPGPISVQVIDGSVEFRTADGASALKRGQMVTLGASISHSVYAKERSFFMVTISLPNP